jgi:hypothetical protein
MILHALHKTPAGIYNLPKRPLQYAAIDSKYVINMCKPHMASNSRSDVQCVVILRVSLRYLTCKLTQIISCPLAQWLRKCLGLRPAEALELSLP